MAGPDLKSGMEEKRQTQLERLQSTLNRSERNVPFHRKRFRGNGADSIKIEHVRDITALPFMDRTDLSAHYPYGLFAVPLRDIVRIHTAAGTGSNPTVSGYTKQDLRVWRELVARSLRESNVTDHDILQIRLHPGLGNWGRDYKDGAEEAGAGVIPNIPLSVEKQLMVLRDYKTTTLITTPGMAARLADYMFKSEINPTILNLKTVILVGEYADHEFRRQIEDRVHAETWAHYGLNEVPGPAIACECACHDGLHVNEDHFLPEIIDSATNESAPPGEEGELTLTTLTTRAFPLIRFKTGDRARILPDPCPCGSLFARIEWKGVRTDHLLTVGGVKIHEDQIRAQIEQILGRPSDFRYTVTSEQGIDPYLEIWLCVDDHMFSDEIKMLEKTVKKAGDSLAENLGIPITVHLTEKRSLF